MTITAGVSAVTTATLGPLVRAYTATAPARTAAGATTRARALRAASLAVFASPSTALFAASESDSEAGHVGLVLFLVRLDGIFSRQRGVFMFRRCGQRRERTGREEEMGLANSSISLFLVLLVVIVVMVVNYRLWILVWSIIALIVAIVEAVSMVCAVVPFIVLVSCIVFKAEASRSSVSISFGRSLRV